MGSNASLSVVLKGWREGAHPTKSIYLPFVSTVGRFPPVSFDLYFSLFFFLSSSFPNIHTLLFLLPLLFPSPVRRSVQHVHANSIPRPWYTRREFIASRANLKGCQASASRKEAMEEAGFRRSMCIFIPDAIYNYV